MNNDKVKVVRLIVYEGDRGWVESTVMASIHGTKVFGTKENLDRKITVTTLTEFSEEIKQ